MLQKYPKISIVLVNKNSGEFLEECILSVVNQNYPNLELVLIDGKSTDNSLDIIKQYENYFSCWISEKDESQYHAVQKGFEKTSGDIMAWMNSDDKYLPGSLHTVALIFNEFPKINWLMGYPGEYSKEGVLLHRISLSWTRWSKLRYYTYDFQFIQQESCFWTRSLWEKAGGNVFTSYSLAGDMELWTRFFRHEKLHTTIAALAGFRQHNSEQRSVLKRNEYLAECNEILKSELSRFSVFKLYGHFSFTKFLF